MQKQCLFVIGYIANELSFKESNVVRIPQSHWDYLQFIIPKMIRLTWVRT